MSLPNTENLLPHKKIVIVLYWILTMTLVFKNKNKAKIMNSKPKELE